MGRRQPRDHLLIYCVAGRGEVDLDGDAHPVGPGDVLLFRMQTGAVAKHLGVQAETGPAPTFIHAYSGHGVVESPLSRPWQRRIVARFAFPEEV